MSGAAVKPINEKLVLIFDEAAGKVKVSIDCLSAGQCSTSAFLDFQRHCKEEGIEITALPGQGPFDFDFQLARFKKERKNAKRD